METNFRGNISLLTQSSFFTDADNSTERRRQEIRIDHALLLFQRFILPLYRNIALRHKILTGRGWLSRKGKGFPARNREYANFVTLNEMQECEFAGSLSSTMRRESRIKRRPRPRVTWDHFRLDFLRFETIFPAVVITNNDVNGSYIPCTVESLNRKSWGELRCRMREARRAEDREGRLPFIELPVR